MPKPLAALVELLVREHDLYSLRDVARLIDLESADEQRKVYGVKKPNARGSYELTIALLDKAGFLNEKGRRFLELDHPVSDAERAAEAIAAAESLEALLRQRRERSEPRGAAQ